MIELVGSTGGSRKEFRQIINMSKDLKVRVWKRFKLEDKDKFEDIRARYKKVSEENGAEIKGVHYITRSEPFPSLYENADFSLYAIRNSIKDGETKTNEILKGISK
jgi:hypothetical protein